MDNQWKSDIDQRLKDSDYESLSPNEKMWVDEHLGGKAGYTSLAQLVLEATATSVMPTQANTKAVLMAKMKSRHQPAWQKALAFRVPAYLASALVVLAIVTTAALMPKPVPPQPSPPIQLVKVDTVYLQSVPDTVFVERQVKVPVYIAVNKTPPKDKPLLTKTPSKLTGKPLAAQSEVQDFLVRAE